MRLATGVAQSPLRLFARFPVRFAGGPCDNPVGPVLFHDRPVQGVMVERAFPGEKPAILAGYPYRVTALCRSAAGGLTHASQP
jgi:hypothetical protein